MENQNRADRRKNRFGGGRATQHGGWPAVQPNPVFHAETPDEGSADEPGASKPDDTDDPAPAEKGSSED